MAKLLPSVGWIKMKLGMQVGIGPCNIVLDGDPALPLPKVGGASPLFSAHICCGQMAGWIKLPLGREVGLNPSEIVLDGHQAPAPQKGVEPPIFRPCLLWPNGSMDQDVTSLGRKVGHIPSDIVLDGDPAPPPPKGDGTPISTHTCCGHMAGWIKMPFDRVVGLSPAMLC